MLNEKHLNLCYYCTKYVINIHLDLWTLIDLDEMNIMSEDRMITDKNQ